MRRVKAGTGAAACGAIALAVAGAGAATAAAGQRVHASASKARLKADPNGGLEFNKRKIKVSAGRVTLVMRNPSTSMTDHGIAIEGNGVDKEGKVVGPGRKSRVTVRLKRGRYVFYCPAPGHRQAGMKGKLIVR